MKKLFSLLCLFFFISVQCYAGISTIGESTWAGLGEWAGQTKTGMAQWMGQDLPSGSVSCSTTPSYSNTNAAYADTDLKEDINRSYIGTLLTPSSEIDVCEVSFYLTDKDNSNPGDFTAEIWTTGGESRASTLGTSELVAWSNTWDDTEVTFTFDPPVTVPTSLIAFVVTHDGTVSTSTEVEVEYSDDVGAHCYWDNNGVIKNSDEGSNTKFKIFATE